MVEPLLFPMISTADRRYGGQIDLHGPAIIAADGTVTFHFQADSTPGLYRLTIGGTEQYQLSFYAVDPNRPSRNPTRR